MESISSGHQLALLYSLRLVGGANGSASKAVDESKKLQGLFTSWMTAYEQNGEPEVLAYRLQHSTQAALCYNSLDGQDRQVVQYLKEACSATGSHLYLASLDRRVEGSCGEYDYYDRWHHDEDEHHSINEVDSVTVMLNSVADLNGTSLGRYIEIKEDAIIQDGLFDRNPDEEDHEVGDGFATHHYLETVTTTF